MALIYNASFDSTTRVLSLLDKAGNTISECNVPATQPLTLKATADNSSVKLTKQGKINNTFEVDTGNGWEAYTLGTVINLNAGESCKWRCTNHPTTQSDWNYVIFVLKGTIEAYGNINSMLSNNFKSIESLADYPHAFTQLFTGQSALTKAPFLPATTLSNNCYLSMFQGTGITRAPVLPATTLASSCYSSMFMNCKSLTQAPALPATTVFAGCYESMFRGCSALTQAPVLPATEMQSRCYASMLRGTAITQAPALPATTLAANCYDSLFWDCGSLTQAPALPATTIPMRAYKSMFQNCTSLTTPPALPATTIDTYAYAQMFQGCTSLAQAPALPATIISVSCYNGMFSGCTALTEVRIAATTTATNAFTNWLNNVAATGDFYCDPNTTIFPSGAAGIPANWSRWLYGAEDTGTTTTMYHNGVAETVRVGTSSYGACYSAQGWAGFQLLAKMHALGYTLGAQTPLTMYHGSDPVSAYSCDANVSDGFTETMYNVGDGNGYLDIATQNANGYTLTATNP